MRNPRAIRQRHHLISAPLFQFSNSRTSSYLPCAAWRILAGLTRNCTNAGGSVIHASSKAVADTKLYWLALALTPGLGPTRTAAPDRRFQRARSRSSRRRSRNWRRAGCRLWQRRRSAPANRWPKPSRRWCAPPPPAPKSSALTMSLIPSAARDLRSSGGAVRSGRRRGAEHAGALRSSERGIPRLTAWA